MAGRYFDQWQVGDTVAHEVTRTVTETDNVLISALTHNPQPLHLDHEIAAASEFGNPLVNSVFTFGLMVGLPAATLPGGEPVYAGAPDSVAPAMRSATAVQTATVPDCKGPDSPQTRSANRSREQQV